MYAYFVIIATFLWTGLLIGISFMEAPLKFRAPNITRVLGLGIGKLVFTALNRMEWVLALIIGISFSQSPIASPSFPFYILPVALLLVQTLWLLPALVKRITLYQQGTPPPASAIHWVFIALELLKLISLFVAGIHFLQQILPV